MNNMETALSQAAILTFEELGFLFPTEEFDHENMANVRDGSVFVRFNGPVNGSLLLSLHGGLLPMVAANMLGQDELPGQEMQQDALRELANVICGNALPMIAGKQEVFHLDAPHEISLDEEKSLLLTMPSATVRIGLDEGRADVSLFLDEEIKTT